MTRRWALVVTRRWALVVTRRRTLSLVAIAVAGAVAAGCGDEAATAPGPATATPAGSVEPGASVGPDASAAPSGGEAPAPDGSEPTAIPTPPEARAPSAPPPPADAPTPGADEESAAGAGDEEAPAVPAAFVITDARVRPAERSVPAFLPLTLRVTNRTDAAQTVVLETVPPVSLFAAPGRSVFARVAGQRPGDYRLQLGGGQEATLITLAEPTP